MRGQVSCALTNAGFHSKAMFISDVYCRCRMDGCALQTSRSSQSRKIISRQQDSPCDRRNHTLKTQQ